MSRTRSSLSGTSSRIMGRLFGALAVTSLLVLVGGAAFLATWTIPAPNESVEKVIPDERLPR